MRISNKDGQVYRRRNIQADRHAGRERRKGMKRKKREKTISRKEKEMLMFEIQTYIQNR